MTAQTLERGVGQNGQVWVVGEKTAHRLTVWSLSMELFSGVMPYRYQCLAHGVLMLLLLYHELWGRKSAKLARWLTRTPQVVIYKQGISK